MFAIHKLSDTATTPKRVTDGSAGYDVFAAKDDVVPARGRKLIPLDISVSFPNDHVLRIAPRSGLAVKKGIDVGAGIGDSDYTGNYHVLLFNHSDEDYEIKTGDRIAQIMFIKISTPELVEMDEKEFKEAVADSSRQDGGFGSSGK
jgi:deoxyuridine 5'-triphosphate nucleotidohydrolase